MIKCHLAVNQAIPIFVKLPIVFGDELYKP